MDDKELPYYATNLHPSVGTLYINPKLNMFIYGLDQLVIPEKKGVVITKSFNGFEKKVPSWHQNDADITDDVAYEGSHSIQVKGFSSTFKYPLDSPDFINAEKLIIDASVYCHYGDKTESKLIVSVENEEGTYIWKELNINKYIKAYTHWWPVHFEAEVTLSEIRPASTLKVFLWNTDEVTAYIDSFGVEIIQL